MLLSEGYANISMTMLYYGNKQGKFGAHFPFNFDFITDVSNNSNARDFVYTIQKWLTYKPFAATANWVVRTKIYTIITDNYEEIQCISRKN